jgi:hypothetical protein
MLTGARVSIRLKVRLDSTRVNPKVKMLMFRIRSFFVALDATSPSHMYISMPFISHVPTSALHDTLSQPHSQVSSATHSITHRTKSFHKHSSYKPYYYFFATSSQTHHPQSPKDLKQAVQRGRRGMRARLQAAGLQASNKEVTTGSRELCL